MVKDHNKKYDALEKDNNCRLEMLEDKVISPEFS